MRRAVGSVGLMALAAAMSGCGTGDARTGTTAKYDSAGVAVVVNRVTPEAVPVFTLDEPVLRIGEAFGGREVQFHRVVAGDIADDGRILVADAGSATVRAFSSGGELLFMAGARGDGPGEFRSMSSLDVLADGDVVVYDPSSARVTRLTATGALRDTRPVPPLPGGGLGYVHPLPDGSALGIRLEVEIVEDEPLVVGTYRSPALLLLLDGSLQVTDTLLTFPGVERHYYPKGGYDRARFTYPLMAARAVYAFAGPCAYAVLGRTVSIGEVCVGDGAPARRIEWPAAPLALSHDQFAARAAAVVARRTGLEISAGELLDRYPMAIPDALPPAGGLIAHAGGGLWLADFFERDEPASRWWVFDADGALRARVILPRVHRILDIAGGRLLVVERDELDVERIAVHALPAPLAGGGS